MRSFRLVLFILLLLLPAVPALAERRVALVFGADAYREVRPLANAVNDAVAVQGLLEGLGFAVELETNRDLRRMRRALEDFADEAAGADLALVFFAGHGVEVEGRNLLLPVDAGGATAAELVASALPLEEVVATLRRIAPAALVILDACRDDPFGAGGAEGRGAVALAGPEAAAVRPMGRVGQADGLLFAFAAAPGATASDGAGTNSPFTESLLRHFATPGLEVRSALTLVQQDVYDRTRNAQLPYIEAALPATVFLSPDAEDLPERARLLLAMAGIGADLRAQVERIAADRDMPLAPLYASAVAGGLASLGWEAREARLIEAAEAFVTTRERLLTLESNDSRVQSLRAEAESLLELGERQAALAALDAARAIDRAAGDANAEVAVERRRSEADSALAAAGTHAAGFAYAAALADYAEAADLYARAAALAVADGRPSPRAALDGETRALWDMGDLHRTIGNTQAALATYRRWQAAAEARLTTVPDDILWQRDLSASHNKIGDVLRDQGDLAGAAQAYRAGHAIFERLAAQDPANIWRRDLSVSHNRIGDVLRDQGDLAGAALAYRASLAIRERLAAQDPANALWQSDLSVSHEKIGDVLRAQGDLAGAAQAYRASLAISEHLVAQDRANAGWQRDLSVSHERIGDVLRDQGDLAGAAQAYRVSLSISEHLAAQDPANAGWQRDLSVSHDRIGDVLRAQGDLAGAAQAYRASLAISERLAAQDPANAGWQRDLSVSRNNIGDVLRDQGDPAGAAQAYRASMAIAERLAARDPANAGWQRDLSISHEKIGDVLRDQGDLAGAAQAYRASLSIAERLAALTPDSVQGQLDLVVSHSRLALVGDDPRGNLTAGLAILRRLQAEGRLPPANAGWIDTFEAALAALPAE